jgi:hypothetical protein
MKKKKSKSSSGTTGERMFLYYANSIGLIATRTQPETRIVWNEDGKLITVIVKRKKDEGEKAPPDFLCCSVARHFYAVEVKEASGDTMPASRVEPAQRRYLADLPNGCARVYVWWTDHNIGKIYPFIAKGSYKLGESGFCQNC